jgi:membrane protease subunit HflK
LLEEANGYQSEVVQRAEGDASRFKQIYTEYSKAPQVMRQRLYLDMVQSVLGNSSKVLVDQKAGNNLLYLPLDKLIQQGTPAGAVPPSSLPSQGATPDLSGTRSGVPDASVSVEQSRSRDGLRSRDRGDPR